jgi:hypothetical protein
MENETKEGRYMRKSTKIIAIILTIVMCIGLLSGCNSNSGPILLDFENYSNTALEKVKGKEVVLYGYFSLNSASDNMAYVTALPFTALINDQSEAETPEFFTVSLSQGAMPVYFTSEPEYTTAPVKITGTLTKVNTYDESNYISFEYAITNATASMIESYSLGVGLKEFATFAKMGYPDVAYQNILQLELYAYDYLDNFPEEESYNEIVKDLEGLTSFEMYADYLKIFKEIHNVYEHYKTQLSEKGEVTKANIQSDANILVKDLIAFMDKYGAFTVTKNKEGYFFLESKNVEYVPGEENINASTENAQTETETTVDNIN